MRQASFLSMRCSATIFIAVLSWQLVPASGTTWAEMITVDEVLYQAGDNPAVLDGTLEMNVSASTLTIVLTNTSTADAGSGGAGNLLAGLGFNLPAGVTVGGGSVSMAGSTAINFTAPGDNDVSSEWAYHNGIPTSGHFDSPPGGDGPAMLPVSTVISTVMSDGTNQFAPGSIDGPPGLDGPDFGVASVNAAVGGQRSIQDEITIMLNLSGTVPADILSQIEANPVSLAFGSPQSSTVPEPSTGFLMACIAACLWARRRGR